MSDLESLAAIAREAEIPLVVDNTLATPYLCQPIEWGADLVVHSMTKFLSGNGTSVGGCVVWGTLRGAPRWRSRPRRAPAFGGNSARPACGPALSIAISQRAFDYRHVER